MLAQSSGGRSPPGVLVGTDSLPTSVEVALPEALQTEGFVLKGLHSVREACVFEWQQPILIVLGCCGVVSRGRFCDEDFGMVQPLKYFLGLKGVPDKTLGGSDQY